MKEYKQKEKSGVEQKAFATRFQSYLMAIFTVIIPGIEMISANPLPVENGVTGRQLVLV